MFGPHVTNLGTDERGFSDRHRAYYERRAEGGCGIIVTEGASVHPSDWPYERAPLASECASGWDAIARACHAHGSLVIASLDHAGGQGSSAYSQLPLLAPSRVPEVNTREVPKWMEEEDIEAVIAGFAAAARSAVGSGCDGIEINAGQHSLVRQFLSGLTNHRSDAWGQDRLAFARRVIAESCRAARAVDPDAIVGLRLSCDELAPWAGITPEMAPDLAADLVDAAGTDSGIDYIVVVRGSIFSVEKTRPDFHEPTGFNIDTCRSVRQRLGPTTAVILQGSIVDADRAEWALDPLNGPVCDGVEMTRAQIADPDLGDKLRSGNGHRARPCVLCNQACQVRDARNPIVSCIVEPSSGHEDRDPDWSAPAGSPRDVLVVGAGPAGMEAARISAARGHRVHIVDRGARTGGLAAVCGPAAGFVDWQRRELEIHGVEIVLDTDASSTERARNADVVILATGSQPGRPDLEIGNGAALVDIADVYRGTAVLPDEGRIVILDPIGGPIAVGLAQSLGDRAILVTPDNIAGNELARTGDLAPANVRLAQSGATIVRRSVPRAVSMRNGSASTATRILVTVQDRFSGETTDLDCAAVVDAGFRLPADLPQFESVPTIPVGDCVAPRTILEAVLEGRRAAFGL